MPYPIDLPNNSNSFCFPLREHLKKRADISRLFKKGAMVGCGGARLFYLANNLAYNRIAFTFARKFGNAVQRNRARRLGREAYRHLRRRLKFGYDMALLVYPIEVAPQSTARFSTNAAPQKFGYKGRAKQLENLFFKAALFA